MITLDYDNMITCSVSCCKRWTKTCSSLVLSSNIALITLAASRRLRDNEQPLERCGIQINKIEKFRKGYGQKLETTILGNSSQ